MSICTSGRGFTVYDKSKDSQSQARISVAFKNRLHFEIHDKVYETGPMFNIKDL